MYFSHWRPFAATEQHKPHGLQVVKQAYKLQEGTPDYAQLGLSSFTPLPKAGSEPGLGYPVFTEYPAGSVEVQAMERRRIQEAEDALIRRRQVGVQV